MCVYCRDQRICWVVWTDYWRGWIFRLVFPRDGFEVVESRVEVYPEDGVRGDARVVQDWTCCATLHT